MSEKKIVIQFNNGSLPADDKLTRDKLRLNKTEQDRKKYIKKLAFKGLEFAKQDPNNDLTESLRQRTYQPTPSFRQDEPPAYRSSTEEVSYAMLSLISGSTPYKEGVKVGGESTYRLYSADRTAYADFKLRSITAIEPEKKWGLQSYNINVQPDFSSAEWSPGYPQPVDEYYLPNFGYIKTKPPVGQYGSWNYVWRSPTMIKTADYVTLSEPYSYYAPRVDTDIYPDNIAIANWLSSGARIMGITDKMQTNLTAINNWYISKTFCLPVDSNSMIFVVLRYSLSQASYYGRRWTLRAGFNGIRRDLKQDDACWGATLENIQNGSGPIVCRYSDQTYLGYEEILEFAESFDDYYEEEEKTLKAFLVSTNSVTEIGVPAAVTAALGKLYPILNKKPTYAKTRVGLSSTGYINSSSYWYGPPDGNDINPYNFTQGWWIYGNPDTDMRYPQYIDFYNFSNGTSTNISIPQYLTYEYSQITNDPDNEFSSFLVDTQNIETFGLLPMGDFPRRFAFDYTRSFTPGMFAVLENASKIKKIVQNSSEDLDLRSFNKIARNYLSNYPRPKVSVDKTALQISVNGTSYLTFDRRIFRIRSNLLYGPDRALERNHAQPFTTLFTSDIYQAWDWGNPSFCKAMLQSLGFTLT